MRSEMDLNALNERFEESSPDELLAWARAQFGMQIVATSSFQTQSIPLLHMISVATPELPVLFLDTGFHFPETLAFRDRIVQKFDLNLIVLKPRLGHEGFRIQHGQLYQQNPELCCFINKIEPFREAIQGKEAWISGIRRDQTEARQTTPILSMDRTGVIKICPLTSWTARDVADYINRLNLPVHPLTSHGYTSIGCAPCTRPALAGTEARSGRWQELDKTECGLHIHIDIDAAHKHDDA